MADIKFVDNSEKVLQAFHTKTGVALNLIGEKASQYTQDGTPVRTGRLRNSVDWQVSDNEKYVEVGFKKADFDKEHYAIYVELGTSKMVGKHMLQKGATQHNDEFKGIAEKVYK